MNDCKYYKSEISNGIIHEFCLNDELKKLNKSKEKEPHCIKNCGKYEKENSIKNETIK